MCDETSVEFTWQLVSEFVSWEFCRYMCNKSKTDSSEVDVLTYLRNMIVERTEKSVSDITKHEIVAKLIMEVKATQSLSRLSCVYAISETVRKICPELESAVCRLLHHLETFFNVIDYSEDSHKQEVMKLRIEAAVNEFSQEANNFLPSPNLLKVVHSWNNQNNHVPKKQKKKVVYNAELFEKVLECIHFESITPSEAKVIGISLCEDGVFSKIISNAEDDLETEQDSAFSIHSSLRSEFTYSQDFKRMTPQFTAAEVLEEPNPPVLDCMYFGPPVHSMQTVSEDPPPLLMATEPPKSPVNNPTSHLRGSNTDIEEREKNCSNDAMDEDDDDIPNWHEKNFHKSKKFTIQSDKDSESDKEGNSLMTIVNNRLNRSNNAQVMEDDSGDDTSDCEKNPKIRFLTPTLYKEGANCNNNQKTSKKVVWISDSDSNDSSVITNPKSSQQNDPNWSCRQSSSFGQPVSPVRKSAKKSEMKSGTVKLFNDKNQSVLDFVNVIRKPIPVLSLGVPRHQATNTKLRKNCGSKPRRKTSNSTKRQKCKLCNIQYKTSLALRRHVFLHHPNRDSDSNSDSSS